jgi:hypothetical protein
MVLAASLVLSFLVLRRLVPLPPAVLAILFLLPTASLRNALLYGQPYPLLLLLVCLALRAARRDRPAAAGLWLAPVLALKLYGAPFLLYLAWRRQWRALVGALAGTALILAGAVAILGWRVHAAYVREVLPASLAGRIQDPYSPKWQTATSLAHRLFQRESDLNPEPVADRPALARGLAAALPAAVALAGVLAAAATPDLARAWAILVAASLAASPMAVTYHFVLLVLPVAVLLSAADLGPRARAIVVIAFVFATSPAPHYFGRFASGWGNLLAYPRLVATLVILALAAAGRLSRRAFGGALAAAGAVGLVAALRTPPEERWTRVEPAHGYLAADPQACAGGLGWLTVAGDRLVRVWSGQPCPARVLPPGADEAVRNAWEQGDADLAEGVAVYVDGQGDLRARAEGRERILLRGPARHPRLAPDRAWVAVQAWRGSWDLWAVELATGRARALTHDAAGELDPSWEPDGRGLVFASDRRRGLGSTALYRIPFGPE